MRSKRWIGFPAAVLMSLAVNATFTSAAEFVNCLEDVAAWDLAAKRNYQTGLRDLVVREAPRFAELAALNMELQIALAEAQHAKLLYLLQSAPERLTTNAGLGAFTNFNWSAEDNAVLSESDDSFAELQDKIESLSERNDGHADWPALRALVRDELARSDTFKEITARFMTARTEAEVQLAICESD